MSLFVHVPRTAVAGARAAQPKTGAPFRAGGPRWTLFVLGRGRLAVTFHQRVWVKAQDTNHHRLKIGQIGEHIINTLNSRLFTCIQVMLVACTC